jgi:polyferredoxin
MVGLTTVSFFKGRYWCGNICPHGSLFDSLLYPITNNKKIPSFFKSKALGIIFFIFFL